MANYLIRIDKLMLKLQQLLDAKDNGTILEIDSDSYTTNPCHCPLTFIGDVHGAKNWYRECCLNADYSIQLGDLTNSPMFYQYFDELNPNHHKYIHGNHDWLKGPMPPHYLGAYGTWELEELGLKICYLSGAYSVDRKRRTLDNRDPVHDNEELSYTELNDAIDYIVKQQPDVIVTHTAPYSTFDNLILLPHYGKIKSRTSQALDIILEQWQPTLWVFGHFHQNRHFYYNKTTFICVNLQTTLPFL